MSAFLNKLRHPSTSADSRTRRSRSSSTLADNDAPPTSQQAPSPSPQRTTGASGSLFIENFDPSPQPAQPSESPQPPYVEPSSPHRKRHPGPMPETRTTPSRPAPLQVPDSGPRPAGTPKLTLTQEGSNSPHSVSDHSPIHDYHRRPPSQARHPVGLGLGKPNEDEDGDFDARPNNHYTALPSASQRAVSLAQDGRDRPSSFASSQHDPSAHGQHGIRSRSGSLVSRVTSRIGPASPNSLTPVDSVGKSSKKSKRRSRRRSINSQMSGHSSVVAALAKGGLHIASATGDEALAKAAKTRKVSSGMKRSPYLTRGGRDMDDDDDDGESDDDDIDFDDEEDDDSDLAEDLSVLGYAVASNRRNSDFHALFPSVDEGDYLIDDYGCALSKDILVQGRLYVSENYLCFHANIFGWTTDVVIPFVEIRSIEKKMTALVIPNAIGVSTANARYTFASFISRDTVYDVMMNIWRLCNPNAVMSALSLSATPSRPGSISGELASTIATATPGGQGESGGGQDGVPGDHKPTQCDCGRDGKHYPETALEAIFPSTPEKVYNLMFNSSWLRTFLSDSQNLRDIEYSDWRPISPSSPNLTRSLSYTKPLNGSIGPKQTTCHITDSREHFDPDQYIVMITTTRTPDVPSGGVFSVKTRTCFMWAGPESTKVIVTTGVEWTGKSWIKGIIEKSAIDGQKQYHDDLKLSMLSYIQSHLSEFLSPGAKPAVDQPNAPTPPRTNSGSGSGITSGGTSSEAQEYAAKARKERHDADWWNLQAGIDSLVRGGKTIGEGLKACIDSVADMLFDSGLNKQGILWILIVLLVLSNFYTYLYADTSRSSRGIARGGEVRFAGERRGQQQLSRSVYDDQVAETVRMVLSQQRTLMEPVEEVKELLRVLDSVEWRMSKLRDEIRGVIEESSSVRENTALKGDEID
ncbi:GRAM domain-containing protein [Cryptococcus neoformans AD2-60a]|nr:GRAM domain-containing protein [Cryptococcus neoformans var. grubii AD2-60a]OXC87036.1 GRAM domain-containing protein [Cryptococcus neoformans var. grubii AD1-7a]OXH39315.1 GRAM domain-containing protein [Cryptococcus neoformans var. grubii]